jgi:hypothetical protein
MRFGNQERRHNTLVKSMIPFARLRQLLLTPVLFSPVLLAQDVTLTKRIVSFPGLKPSHAHCFFDLQAQFLDNETLVLTSPICAKAGHISGYQYAIASLDGNIRYSVELSESSNRVYIGPPGYLFFPADRQGWLIYDITLHPKWTVPIPSGEFPGSVSLSPSRTAAALSSHIVNNESKYHWQLFTGEPLARIGEYDGEMPFPGITDSGAIQIRESNQPVAVTVEPTAGEFWFFDSHYQLTRRSSSGTDNIISNATWLAPKSRYPPFCSSSFSIAEPRKILAYCDSGVYLPDGFALLVHTYLRSNLRYSVYDKTGKIITQGTYPYSSPPSLSPDGHKIAVTQGKTVVLYDLP